MERSLVLDGLDYMEGRSGCVGTTLYYKNGEKIYLPYTIDELQEALDNKCFQSKEEQRLQSEKNWLLLGS